MEKQPAVYILASSRKGTLYTGVTSNLVGRIWQHREHIVDGFSKRYDVTRLVWYELAGSMEGAITREKQIKKWNRGWKIRLVEEANPAWKDLWSVIIDHAEVSGSPPARG
ncbi:MAG: GIY-YIG nuclease family protein [Proteobacteria bacterium]|nr:GIY-YIG nuclease family protein [Pseudomonadota bacterium]